MQDIRSQIDTRSAGSARHNGKHLTDGNGATRMIEMWERKLCLFACFCFKMSHEKFTFFSLVRLLKEKKQLDN